MRLVYLALSGTPRGCIEFYGISVLSVEKSTEQELYLVFELASDGPIWKYIQREGSHFGWEDMTNIFSLIASGLWDGLHKMQMAHGYFLRLLDAIYIDVSDLHENNVLVTKRLYADVAIPEAKIPVLIDFGRGKVKRVFVNQDGDSHISDEQRRTRDDFSFSPHTISEDIQAYGGLIWELTSRWMQMTNRRTIPRPLVELMSDCLALRLERLTSMEGVIWSFEELERQLPGHAPQGKRVILEEISWKEAKALLEPHLARASDRPTPSAPSYRQADAFSFPTIGWTHDSDEEEL